MLKAAAQTGSSPRIAEAETAGLPSAAAMAAHSFRTMLPSCPSPFQVRRLLVDAREEVKTMLTARMQVGREGRGGGRGEETGRKEDGPHAPAHPLTQSPAVLIFSADR